MFGFGEGAADILKTMAPQFFDENGNMNNDAVQGYLSAKGLIGQKDAGNQKFAQGFAQSANQNMDKYGMASAQDPQGLMMSAQNAGKMPQPQAPQLSMNQGLMGGSMNYGGAPQMQNPWARKGLMG